MNRLGILPTQESTHPNLFNLQKCVMRSNCLWLYGVDCRGASVAIQIPDFQPTFMVPIPDDWDEMPPDEDNEDSEDSGTERREQKHPLFETLGCTPKWDIVHMTPLLGFTNFRKDGMLRFRTANIKQYRNMIKNLNSRNQLIYHENIPLSCQFLQQTNFQYYDWYEFKGVPLERQGFTNLTFRASMSSLKKYTGTIDWKTPPTLKLFVRVIPVSRDGMVQKEWAYVPDAQRECDRIAALGCAYVWAHDQDSRVVHQTIFSLLPAADRVFSNEADLLRAFREELLSFDPDDVFMFPDHTHDLWYIGQRMKTLGIDHQLNLGRWEKSQLDLKPNQADFSDRNLFPMDLALHAKNPELYDLHYCSGMKEIRRKPVPKSQLLWDRRHVNQWMVQPEQRHLILDMLKQDLQLMVDMERDMNMRLGFANLGRVCDTDLSDTVQQGQQFRVYNALCRFCVQEGFYVNKEMLSSKALRFSIKQQPATYNDEPHLELNLKIRRESDAEMKRLDPTKKKAKKKERELEGGSVLDPAAHFYDEDPVAVLDFNSLYPSIMMAFNIGPSTLVYDPKYLNVPGVEYIYVSINSSETVAYAKVQDVVGKLLRLLVDSRTEIRDRQGKEKDPFKKSVLDSLQLAMKVTCNATYGFFGADTKKTWFPVKDIMYSVTSIGRYLQRKCVHYLGTHYDIPTVYGDTDSVFVIAPLPKHATNIEELTLWAKAKYQLETEFSWQKVCERFSTAALAKWARLKYKQPDEMTWDTLAAQFDLKPIEQWSLQHQKCALLCFIYEKLSAECTKLFPHPIVLGFENMLLRLALYHAKKNYYAQIVDDKNPSTVKAKDKVTGMAMKKREWCPFTRETLTEVARMIEWNETEKIKPYLEQQIDALANGQVPLDKLIITKLYKGKEKYKSMMGIHLQMVLKMEKRGRTTIRALQRIPFIVIRGHEKLSMRSEDPEWVRTKNLPIDYEYYLKHQLEKPLFKQMLFHSHVFQVDRFIQNAVCRVKAKIMGSNTFSTIRQTQTKKHDRE